ncbi:MAG: transcriptional regulator [Zestosphaera tikiterensis]|uniref:Transcriptional regulator n=1 Tax=Zestosphaera tikiterensis TaxID=1973259 RepID=A0A2R7Y738_9CREN|nr:MAG: transcriptional regulator [Zestosphaera tikiterensis]
MNKDKMVGITLLIGSIVVILVYGWLVFLSEYWKIVLQLTGFIAVAGVFGILAWIGYTLATTPPPKPIEEIEKEIEEELKKLETEGKVSTQQGVGTTDVNKQERV